MPVAPDLYSLKRRLDRYFWHTNTPEVIYLRNILNEHFSAFSNIAVVGGLVRDFAREGRSAFRSDVDLVIEATEGEVAALAKKLSARRNKFGGFGLYLSPWKIDFWALEATWAAKTGHVCVCKLDDVIRCTFFDWDAALYDLRHRKVICNSAYLDTIRKKEIEINLRPNPSIGANLLRSVRRLLLWNLQAGPRLTNFIIENLDYESFRTMKQQECLEYANPVLLHFPDLETLRHQLFERERRKGVYASKTQFSLALEPGVHDPRVRN
jgi:hypothetical protein